MITSRLKSALEKFGTPLQFGSCPESGRLEGSFSLRTLLQMRKEHDLESWVIYADLIKAFDSIHHELLFRILEKFGIPLSLIKVIRKLYNNFKIEICVGKCKAEIDYAAGVKQGDNFAPILFIIVIQFLAELLEKNGINKVPVKQSFAKVLTFAIKVVS